MISFSQVLKSLREKPYSTQGQNLKAMLAHTLGSTVICMQMARCLNTQLWALGELHTLDTHTCVFIHANTHSQNSHQARIVHIKSYHYVIIVFLIPHITPYILYEHIMLYHATFISCVTGHHTTSWHSPLSFRSHCTYVPLGITTCHSASRPPTSP